ncbi:serine--tRNA ligase [Myxococcota bacterium]|nr:serine--tRNA ligase [Myxococcota bacterium]MBU1380886.1 serine--tRNA ligase [Myxococcota bacterium]MBU1497014.1 serine--tRNA ligase [Myxococcota bacterium]
MIDPKLLDDEQLEKTLAKRNARYAQMAVELAKINTEWKTLKSEIENLRFEQKNRSNSMKTLKGDEAAALREELKTLSDDIKAKSAVLSELEEKKNNLALYIPNIPMEDTPDGGEENNREILRWGDIKKLENPLPHWELGEKLGILDFDRAAKMSGSRFSILKGAGARLERAIVSFMLDQHTSRGYTEMSMPLLVKRETMIGTGQLPNLEEDAYKTAGDDPYYLIPTAEVVLVNSRRDEILDLQELPVKYVGATPCFRSEAGSYGRDVRGLIRQHQFMKVELVKITTPEDAEKELLALREDAENILRLLGLPYRVVMLAKGDMGFSSARTFDLEVWLPSENTYREISSCSNCTDFQARRAKIRYRPANGEKPVLCHTLNGSGLAVGRTLLSILENYQTPEGNVIIPEILRPYLGGKTIITPSGLE